MPNTRCTWDLAGPSRPFLEYYGLRCRFGLFWSSDRFLRLSFPVGFKQQSRASYWVLRIVSTRPSPYALVLLCSLSSPVVYVRCSCGLSVSRHILLRAARLPPTLKLRRTYGYTKYSICAVLSTIGSSLVHSLYRVVQE